MKQLNVGMIGGGFMAKAHSMAYASVPMFFWPTNVKPHRKTIVEVNEELAKTACNRFGFEKYETNWKKMVNDPSIDIVDIVTPNYLHAEMAIEAAKAGKHIISEKPLGRDSTETKKMLEAVQKYGVKHMVAYNYRKTPAVALAKKIISDGKIGKILNFRGTYLQDWSADPNSPLSWRFEKEKAGSGALGDIGAHVIDIARYLVGDFKEVMALNRTWIKERPKSNNNFDSLGSIKANENVQFGNVDVDDEISTLIKFENETIGSIEATRNAWGRNNFITFEIHGEKGTIYFDYERRDELKVAFKDDPDEFRGFRTIYTGPNHPNGEYLWPIAALGIGYSETKIIEVNDFLQSIVGGGVDYVDFKDGHEIAVICDKILESAKNNEWVKIAE